MSGYCVALLAEGPVGLVSISITARTVSVLPAEQLLHEAQAVAYGPQFVEGSRETPLLALAGIELPHKGRRLVPMNSFCMWPRQSHMVPSVVHLHHGSDAFACTVTVLGNCMHHYLHAPCCVMQVKLFYLFGMYTAVLCFCGTTPDHMTVLTTAGSMPCSCMPADAYMPTTVLQLKSDFVSYDVCHAVAQVVLQPHSAVRRKHRGRQSNRAL
jgi:hypothetical protein